MKELQSQLAETQAALQESQDKFNLIFHESLDVILIVDGQGGQILDINQTVHDVLGYEREALIGQPFSNLFPPKKESSKTDIEQLRVHGIALEAQQFLRVDGSVCPMDLTFKLVPWQNDTAILITLRDVTERIKAEEAQQKLIQELDSFAHTVAHDLKAPLNVIIGAAGILDELDTVKSNEEVRQLVGIILQSGSKMSNIIEELLLLAEVRDTEVEFEPLDMADIVAEAQQRLSYTIKEKQAEIILPPTWPVALGYGPWIEEVWVNYISNALKYGGQPPRVELGADVQSGGMAVRFWVRDNGAGLAPEEQTRLFTPFTQLSRVRAEGHGLGLSIVRHIVEKLGGQVGVQSEVGQGSVFSFTLPGVEHTVHDPTKTAVE